MIMNNYITKSSFSYLAGKGASNIQTLAAFSNGIVNFSGSFQLFYKHTACCMLVSCFLFTGCDGGAQLGMQAGDEASNKTVGVVNSDVRPLAHNQEQLSSVDTVSTLSTALASINIRHLKDDVSRDHFSVTVDHLSTQNHRELMEQRCRQIMKESDDKRTKELKEVFDKRIGLKEAIEEDVFPCVVSLATKDGMFGTGFFQHPMWLVSNAHVLPSSTDLANTTLTNHQIEPGSKLNVAKSFHRSHKNPKAPDIAIVNVAFRPGGGSKGLPMNFSTDDSNEESILFYTYFSPNEKTPIIKYLTPRDTTGFPLLYECSDGTNPQLGSSGAPIIEARVINIKPIPKWQFSTVGMVYARCQNKARNKQKMVCAIPVKDDLEQLRIKVIAPVEVAERCVQMLAECLKVSATQEAQRCFSNASEMYSEARKNFIAFKEGATGLEIALPDGLEKLRGRCTIDHSGFLLTKNQAHLCDNQWSDKSSVEEKPDSPQSLVIPTPKLNDSKKKIAVLCPNCEGGGRYLYDLSNENKDLILICEECSSVWLGPDKVGRDDVVSDEELGKSFGVADSESLFGDASGWTQVDTNHFENWDDIELIRITRDK